MGFDIPEPFCWDESFKVFVSILVHDYRRYLYTIMQFIRKQIKNRLVIWVTSLDEHLLLWYHVTVLCIIFLFCLEVFCAHVG